MIGISLSTLGWIAFFVAVSWATPRAWLSVALVSMTAVFLIRFSPWSLPVLLSLTLVIGFATINRKHDHKFLIGSILFCFLALIVYRFYMDLKVETNSIILLGFAFYILRAIHILIDTYTGRLSKFTWSELVTWLWFLPTLQIGPINRFEPFKRDLIRRRWDSELFVLGLKRILYGYFKIVVIANYMINQLLLDWINQINNDTWIFHYLDNIHYGLDLYLKFSGYSDIAIGISLLLGFKIMDNFNYPFLATNIADFWKRWHISLSSWCRDYVYFPVFSLFRSPALAALATMLILGLWHELSIRYFLWGLWHGLGIAACQRWQKTETSVFLNSGSAAWLWKISARFITLNFVILSFTFTSTSSVDELIERWGILLGL